MPPLLTSSVIGSKKELAGGTFNIAFVSHKEDSVVVSPTRVSNVTGWKPLKPPGPRRIKRQVNDGNITQVFRSLRNGAALPACHTTKGNRDQIPLRQDPRNTTTMSTGEACSPTDPMASNEVAPSPRSTAAGAPRLGPLHTAARQRRSRAPSRV